MVKRHNQLMLLLLAASDVTAAGMAFVAAYCENLLAVHFHVINSPIALRDLIPAGALGAVLCIPVFARSGLYQPKRTKRFVAELPIILRAVCTVWCITYVVVGLLKHPSSSRVLMASVLASWLLTAGLSRLVGRQILRYFRKRGLNLRYAAIVGTGRLGQTLYHCIRRNTWTGIEPAYFVSTSGSRTSLLRRDVVPLAGNINDILVARPVDIVLLALPAQDHRVVEELLNQLANTEYDIRVVPDMLSFHFLRHEVDQLDGLPIVTLTHTPLGGWNRVLKRGMDLIISIPATVVLALPMLLIGVLVKFTSKGPVFHSQVRTSVGGRHFRILKFRTMVADAETNTGPVWASDDDPRSTRIGRFLRKTGLDELPQLLNVVRGQMSLVGPRPERPELVERFRTHVPRYMLRHHAKAGLTGWAQVNGLRGRTSIRKRLQYDMFYICNWTLGFDIRIILLTLFPFLSRARFRRKGLAAARPLEGDLQWLTLPNSALSNAPVHPRA